MSRTAIASKFKIRGTKFIAVDNFPNERRYRAGKLSTAINLVPLMSDKNFNGSLVESSPRLSLPYTISLVYFTLSPSPLDFQ